MTTHERALLALAGVVAAAAIVIAVNSRHVEATPAPGAAMAQWNRQMDQAIVDARREYDRARTRQVYLRDGDAAGQLYELCTNFPPPANPANQAKCKTLLDRIAREDAAHDAADAKKKAEW